MSSVRVPIDTKFTAYVFEFLIRVYLVYNSSETDAVTAAGGVPAGVFAHFTDSAVFALELDLHTGVF